MAYIKPYAVRISPEWPCCRCGRKGPWRINTTGINGYGADFCSVHAKEQLKRSGNQQLLETFYRRERRK